MNPLKKGTHKRMILDALMSGRKLSSLSGFLMMNTVKLTSRISDLRKSGIPIKGDWVYPKNKPRYMVYYMTPEARKNMNIIK